MKNYPSLAAIRKDIADGNLSCSQLVRFYLKRIDENQHLNAFLEVFTEEALQQAASIDQKLKEGTAGKLAGMVIGIKDNICYKGHKVSASSKILEGFESLYNATVVDRLIAEDAIIIGRTNCDEFAMGSANENSAFGVVRNPVNTDCVPGGSSGGSAAAVAADLCQATLGSDTGGSIRQPASFCGVVGYKPTYGVVSRNGLIAYASSFDQIGPLTKSVYDAALITEVIGGKDPFDSTSSSREVPAYSQEKADDKPKRIAYLKQYLDKKGIDKEVKQELLDTIEKLKADGHRVEAVDFPFLDALVPTYYVLTTAEASSNLARFDGVHFGYRSELSDSLETTYKKSRTEGFGTEVKRRIMLGTFVLSSGYYDAYYTKAQRVRALISKRTEEILSDYDYIITPTTPHTAFEIGRENNDPTVAYLEDIFTVHANITGQPAISIPKGKHSNGMPIGIQLMTGKFNDASLFSFSLYLESLK